jgi:hypothetical protein
MTPIHSSSLFTFTSQVAIFLPSFVLTVIAALPGPTAATVPF